MRKTRLVAVFESLLFICLYGGSTRGKTALGETRVTTATLELLHMMPLRKEECPEGMSLWRLSTAENRPHQFPVDDQLKELHARACPEALELVVVQRTENFVELYLPAGRGRAERENFLALLAEVMQDVVHRPITCAA